MPSLSPVSLRREKEEGKKGGWDVPSSVSCCPEALLFFHFPLFLRLSFVSSSFPRSVHGCYCLVLPINLAGRMNERRSPSSTCFVSSLRTPPRRHTYLEPFEHQPAPPVTLFRSPSHSHARQIVPKRTHHFISTFQLLLDKIVPTDVRTYVCMVSYQISHIQKTHKNFQT